MRRDFRWGRLHIIWRPMRLRDWRLTERGVMWWRANGVLTLDVCSRFGMLTFRWTDGEQG